MLLRTASPAYVYRVESCGKPHVVKGQRRQCTFHISCGPLIPRAQIDVSRVDVRSSQEPEWHRHRKIGDRDLQPEE